MAQVGSRTRWWAAALVVVVVAAAVVVVVGRDRSVAGRATAERARSVWQRIEATPNDADGAMGVEPALQAFAYLFGDVPGVRVPAGTREPAGLGLSGSGAIRWVLNRWGQLTPEQRRAVGAVLAPPPGEPPRLRQSDKDRAADVLRPRIDQVVADLGAKLGMSIPKPDLYLVDVEHTFDDGSPVYAWTVTLADGESIGENGEGAVIAENGGKASRCLMYLPPSLWRGVAGGVPASATTTIAHELMHCYQGFAYPDLAAARAAPRWIIEGGAEFGGIDYAKKSAAGNWALYLTTPVPLFTRTYTAMGWWFHLQHTGHDPWAVFRTIWSQADGDVAAYVTAGGDRDDVYDTWASSFLRNPGYGDAWEVHGVDVSGETPPRERMSAEGGSLSVEAFDARVAEVTAGAPAGGAETVVLVTANQPVRVHDSGDFEDVHITEGDYCLGGECVCPQDTERAGEEIQRAAAPLWLAVPGGETGTAVTTDTMTIEEYCRKKPPERRRPPAPPAAPAGTHPHAPPANPHSRSPRDPGPADAGSNGDPHLTSFDGRTFDFQAGGEFTLATSTAGDLEIQARQEPFRGPDGAENLSVSVNTAVAANVAGDRVTITAAPGRPLLRIDGTTAAPRAEQALPAGGAVAPAGGGYTVRWPDGSTLWVVPIGGYGLNVVVRPAPARKGALHGMLGPFDGVAGNPAMTDRSGRRYASVTTRELYDVVGKSWRVSAGGSLFDYEPGQSTATFTRDDMPGPAPEPTDEQRAAAEQACAGVPDKVLRQQCAFDIAVTADDAFAAGYRAVHEVVSVGGGTVAVGDKVGPDRLEPGQEKTFTVAGPADLYFASETECSADAAVYWRVTAPDGTESLSVGMCADVGRWHSATAGTWRIVVTVAADAGQGGPFAFRVLAAGDSRRFDVTLPATVADGRPRGAGTLAGAGAEDRFRFAGLAGDKVTITSTVTCTDDDPLYWGLESPDGFVVTLRTRACENLGEQTLTADGTWSVVVFNHTDDQRPHRYGFTAR